METDSRVVIWLTIMTNFFELNYAQVRDMSPKTAEKVLHSIVAARATVSGKGTILRWSEYNENPDLLINRLLAKILIDKMNSKWFDDLSYEDIVVISIESSASYLAVELAFEVMRAFALNRPLRIIRARKTGSEQSLSPAMSDTHCTVEVAPITARGETRNLTVSFPHESDFKSVKLVIVVDDFKATGSTLEGGIKLAQTLLNPTRIVPVAAMGKSWQTIKGSELRANVEQSVVGLDTRYWWDEVCNQAFVTVNELEPLPLIRANKEDF